MMERIRLCKIIIIRHRLGRYRPPDYPVAMAYVPWQHFSDTYEPDKALQCGTIFPELNKPFLGRKGCRL